MSVRKSFVRRAATAAAAVTTTTAVVSGCLLLSTGTAHAAPTTRVVGSASSPGCPSPSYSSISDAVSAAEAGDTVRVCAGTYRERVNVDKRLRFLGAQAGRDARVGRTDLGKESVVGSSSGGFRIGSGVSGVTIDGFTLRGSGESSQNGDGIDAFERGSGYTFVNNVFEDNTNGMNINSNGSSPSVVQRNRFTANNRSGGQGGTGVTLTSGPANNLLVSDNLFRGHSSAAFNSIGDSSNRSTGLIFRSNRSIDDSSMAVVNNADGAKVVGNESTKAAALTGSAVYIVGNTDRLEVSHNKIVGGNGVGVSANGTFGSGPSTNLTIADNYIQDRSTGIRVSDAHRSVTIRGNKVLNSRPGGAPSGFGIRLTSQTSGIKVFGNLVLGSATRDCADESSGSSTAGTANTWRFNAGLTSAPAALCLPGLPSTPPLPSLPLPPVG